MPSSRPVSADLLAVVREYLERDLAPLVPEYHRFQLRIVDRLLATVDREQQLAPTANRAEIARLLQLLEREGNGHTNASADEGLNELDTLADLNRQLARSLRTRTLAHDDRRVLAHLRATLEASLRINNPKWLVSSDASVPRTETGTPQSS